MDHLKNRADLAKRIGLKGDVKPGDMLAKLNAVKAGRATMPSLNRSVRAAKPQGKGIVKALGQKGTTGNFKKIEEKKGKGAAIGALQNKLATRRGEKIPYKGKKK